MAKIQVYDQEAKGLPFASVIVYDSNNNKLGGISVDKDGIGDINDSWLIDKNGKIFVSAVEHNDATILVSKFNGNAFLQSKDKTLGNVVIRVTKKKPKEPIKIVNPYENTNANNKPTQKKMKSPLLPIAVGGLGLGVLIFALTMKTK